MSAPDTGNSATLAFTTSAFAVDITRIGAIEFDVPIINASHLGTTLNEAYIRGDLETIDPFEFDYWFDPQFGTAAKVPPMKSTKRAEPYPGPPIVAAETITLTWPIQSGDNAGLILVGPGFMNHFTLPEFLNNTPQAATGSVQFSGGTSALVWTNPVVTP